MAPYKEQNMSVIMSYIEFGIFVCFSSLFLVMCNAYPRPLTVNLY